MDLKLAMRDKEHSVSAPERQEMSFRGEGFAFITVDGNKHAVEIIESGENFIDLIIDSRRVFVATAEGDNGLWLAADGAVRHVTKVEKRRRRSGRGSRDKKVTPSFPATIVEVLVKEGDFVDAGQPVVVVSAMKMEMTLTSPHAGVVAAVRGELGSAVKPGDELVLIEESRVERG